MAQPFAGVRVLDFTRYVAGPYGTYQFALLGADVIKFEPLEGEESRRNSVCPTWGQRGMSPSWQAMNANKRSIALNLRRPAAVELVKRLAREADIVWENFRPGVMDRLGLGYEALRAVSPSLIYAAVSGFGQNGPERETAAFDGKIQALSGIMSLTGHKATGPTRAGFALSDTIGGMTAAFAVASALFQRTHTGLGQFVDVAMFDASIGFLGQQMCEYTLSGKRHGQLGNLSPSGKVTGDLFQTGDGGLLLAVMTEPQFRSLLHSLDRADALDDPRFRDWDSRAENVDALRQVIEGALAADTAANWEERLTAADVPCSIIRSLHEVAGHKQLEHRDVLQTVDSAYGKLRLMGSAFRLAHGGSHIHTPPPALGADTNSILAEAGYDESEIAALHGDGTI